MVYSYNTANLLIKLFVNLTIDRNFMGGNKDIVPLELCLRLLPSPCINP